MEAPGGYSLFGTARDGLRSRPTSSRPGALLFARELLPLVLVAARGLPLAAFQRPLADRPRRLRVLFQEARAARSRVGLVDRDVGAGLGLQPQLPRVRLRRVQPPEAP